MVIVVDDGGGRRKERGRLGFTSQTDILYVVLIRINITVDRRVVEVKVSGMSNPSVFGFFVLDGDGYTAGFTGCLRYCEEEE